MHRSPPRVRNHRLPAALPPPALRDVTGDDLFWRELAIHKWGPRVDELRAQALAAAGAETAAGAAGPSSSAGAAPAAAGAASAGGGNISGGGGARPSWKDYAIKRMNLRSIW